MKKHSVFPRPHSVGRVLVWLVSLFSLSFSGLHAKPMAVSPRFSGLVDGHKYRLESVALGKGGVCDGKHHGVEKKVYYEQDEAKWTDDGLWVAELGEGGVSFRNVATGRYLSFTPAKDYKTYLRLELVESKGATAVWTVGTTDGAYTFSYADGGTMDYFMETAKDLLVGASSGDGSAKEMRFTLYDEAGKKVAVPVATPFSLYGRGVTFCGMRLPFDQQGGCFFCTLPADGAQKTDVGLQDALSSGWQMRVVAKASGLPVATIGEVKPGEAYVFRLMEGSDVKAEAPVVFTSLPVIDLWTDDPTGAEYAPGKLSLLDGTAQSLQDIRAAFRQRGATARHYPKWSLNVKLLNEKGSSLDTTLLDIRKTDKWILDAMAIDVIRMRNRVCFDIWNLYSKTPYKTDIDRRNGTKGRFVEMLLNGKYNGIYCLTDKINRKLLDLKKEKVNKDKSVTIKGLLYKSNSWDHTGLQLSLLDDSQPMTTVDWNEWELETPDKHPSPAAWQPLRDLYTFCEEPKEKFAEDFEKHFYLDNVADFHLFVLALNLIDNGNKNMFLSTPDFTKGRRFLITPWDLDTSLGGYYDGRFKEGTYDQTAIADERVNKNNPYAKLWEDNLLNYRTYLADRWMTLRKGALSQETVDGLLEKYAGLFIGSGAWQREVARWTEGTPVVGDLKAEIGHVKQWYAQRLEQMDAYFKPLASDIAVVRPPLKNAGTVYSIGGRKVSSASRLQQLPHGVYILDGRKVVK